MKIVAFLFFFCISLNSFAAKKEYSISCKGEDCFRYGWTMQDKQGFYRLDNKCIENDCENLGWSSTDSKGHQFYVQCLPGGCFNEGWTSLNVVGFKFLKDQVTCKNNSCLSYGWTVQTGYDLSGGNVTCKNSDCSRFGGMAFWRNKISKTECKSGDCYKNGWFLTIY